MALYKYAYYYYYAPGSKDLRSYKQQKLKSKCRRLEARQVNWQSVVQKHGVETL